MSNQDQLDETAFWAIMAAMPESKPVFYRLYYDADGVPLFYSMEDLPGTYIDIDQETYARGATNVRVRDNRLVEVTWVTTQKLVPSTHGTPCHPDNVAIVVSTDQEHQYWSKRTYEQS